MHLFKSCLILFFWLILGDNFICMVADPRHLIQQLIFKSLYSNEVKVVCYAWETSLSLSAHCLYVCVS